MTSTQVSCEVRMHKLVMKSCFLYKGAIIGYTNLGDINSYLEKFEQSLAKEDEAEKPLANSMLVLMVRGLFSRLHFPYAQFPCTSMSGDQFYDIFWEAVCRLERCGFRVLACTCDGLSANHRFFNLHYGKNTPLHKVVNPYSADKRHIFFLSDPPHLIKTIRNCWSNPKRCMWVSNTNFVLLNRVLLLTRCTQNDGKHILWSHLSDLYHRNTPDVVSPGLSLIPKLRYEHIKLTSFSKMRVDLAAQVF